MTAEDGHQLSALPRNEGVDAAVTAARRVINALLHAGDNTAAEMSEVAERLDAVADYLEGHAPAVGERMVDMWAGEGYTRRSGVTRALASVKKTAREAPLDDQSAIEV